MGCGQSVKTFVVNDALEGQDLTALKTMYQLGLTDRDIDLLYTAFWDIDADGTGTVQPVELFSFFDMEDGVFEKSIFSVFDEDGSGFINFIEFACALWNYLTLPPIDMGSMAFMMIEPTALKKISVNSVRQVIETVHRKKVDRDPNLLCHVNNFKNKKKLSNGVDIYEFCKWTAENPSLINPLIILQLHLRMQIIGDKFWDRMTLDRADRAEMRSILYVKKLVNEVSAQKMEYQGKVEAYNAAAAKRKREKLGRQGDTRDNTARKESLVMSFFHLKGDTERKKCQHDDNDDDNDDGADEIDLQYEPEPEPEPEPDTSASAASNMPDENDGKAITQHRRRSFYERMRENLGKRHKDLGSKHSSNHPKGGKPSNGRKRSIVDVLTDNFGGKKKYKSSYEDGLKRGKRVNPSYLPGIEAAVPSPNTGKGKNLKTVTTSIAVAQLMKANMSSNTTNQHTKNDGMTHTNNQKKHEHTKDDGKLKPKKRKKSIFESVWESKKTKDSADTIQPAPAKNKKTARIRTRRSSLTGKPKLVVDEEMNENTRHKHGKVSAFG